MKQEKKNNKKQQAPNKETKATKNTMDALNQLDMKPYMYVKIGCTHSNTH